MKTIEKTLHQIFIEAEKEGWDVKHIQDTIGMRCAHYIFNYDARIAVAQELAEVAGEVFDYFGDTVIDEQVDEKGRDKLRDLMNFLNKYPWLSTTYLMDCCNDDNLLEFES